MVRPKRFLERMVARFPAGTFDRIDAVLTAGETRADFLRDAVEQELTRRCVTAMITTPKINVAAVVADAVLTATVTNGDFEDGTRGRVDAMIRTPKIDVSKPRAK